MANPIRNPRTRKVHVGVSLSLAALDLADALARTLDHDNRSALIEALVRNAAAEHLPIAAREEEGGRDDA